MNKTVNVAAAIIIKDGKVLSFQRAYGKHSGAWEFPGGKIEADETAKQALIREIREELSLDINIERFFMNVEHDYDDFHLSMKCYICSMAGEFKLNEHKDFKWLFKEELGSVDWLEADRIVVEELSGEL